MAKADFSKASDEELMSIYKNGAGDEPRAAFDQLFLRHSGRVLGYLMKKLGSRLEADDLLQEVFLKLHRSRHQYDSGLPFSPWLFSIARSTLLDHLRKRKNDDATDPAEVERIASELPGSVAEARGSNASTRAESAAEFLGSMPEAQREAVALRVYDDATFEEIAARLKTSPANARQLVSRGLRHLKSFLSGSDKG